MRVLLCTENTYLVSTGGVDTWCRLLCDGLREVDFRALVLATGGRDSLRRPLPVDHEVFALPSSGSSVDELERAGFSDVAPRLEPSSEEIVEVVLPLLERVLDELVAGDDSVPGTGWIEEVWSLFQRLDLDRCFASPALREWVVGQVDRRFGGDVAPRDSPLRGDDDAVAVLRYFLSALRTPSIAADVVHCVTTGRVALYAIAQKQLHGTPFLLSEHGVSVRESLLEPPRLRSESAISFHQALQAWSARAAYSEADLVATTSLFNRRWELHLGCDPERVRVVPNGIELDLFSPVRPSAQGRPTVVSVGRVVPIKDTLNLIRAAAEVCRRISGARFLVFGSLDEDPLYVYRCRRLIANLGLRRSFLLRGSKGRGPALYSSGHVFALSSISESQPLTVIEAMACGLPVVASDVGGVREILTDAGVLVPPRDPEVLAEGLVSLLADPGRRRELSERSRLRAQQLSHTRMLDSYRDLYRGLA
jgi:glycosyltransferase involved in cell wall biosynthesis